MNKQSEKNVFKKNISDFIEYILNLNIPENVKFDNNGNTYETDSYTFFWMVQQNLFQMIGYEQSDNLPSFSEYLYELVYKNKNCISTLNFDIKNNEVTFKKKVIKIDLNSKNFINFCIDCFQYLEKCDILFLKIKFIYQYTILMVLIFLMKFQNL